jgi:hypothetical protein
VHSLAFISLASIASIAAFATFAPVAVASDERTGNTAGASPVLRSYEPADSVVFRLPGPPVAAPIARKLVTAPPVATSSPLPTKLVPEPVPALPATSLPNLTKPVEPPAKPALPEAMVQDVAFYCQKFVGQWKQADARKLMGTPLRNRAAYDENHTANGKIYAFRDPTGRYRELELDFDSRTGALRTVFVYPPKLSWQDAQRRWKGEVSAADAQQGRKFYSYANRRMDVLVDAQGRVISLGLY